MSIILENRKNIYNFFIHRHLPEAFLDYSLASKITRIQGYFVWSTSHVYQHRGICTCFIKSGTMYLPETSAFKSILGITPVQSIC